MGFPEQYGIHATINVIDLIPFTGSTDDEANDPYLRTNPLQEGRDDRRSPKQGPTTRTMAKCIHNEWDLDAHIKPKILSNWSNLSL